MGCRARGGARRELTQEPALLPQYVQRADLEEHRQAARPILTLAVRERRAFFLVGRASIYLAHRLHARLHLAECIMIECVGRLLSLNRMRHRLIKQLHPELDIRAVLRDPDARIGPDSKITGPSRMARRTRVTKQPFYGVDGNLLIEDLYELSEYRQKQVEDVLNDTFRYRNWIADQYFVTGLMTTYPQLKDEREKRRHRKFYRAKLRGRLFARRVKSVGGQGDPR